MYESFLKRIFDIIVSLIMAIAFSPLFLLVILLIIIDSKGPIFFTQKRVGKNLKNFVILKFRTMTNKKHLVGNKPIIGRESGVTRIGYFLRRFMIDELPQLFNVLRGDMSLVGPRPSIREQLVNLSGQERLRYSVRPGLTGLAQVSGNIHIAWKERYVYDLKYVNNISFINDVKILLRTFILLIIGEDKFKDRPLNLHIKK